MHNLADQQAHRPRLEVSASTELRLIFAGAGAHIHIPHRHYRPETTVWGVSAEESVRQTFHAYLKKHGKRPADQGG